MGKWESPRDVVYQALAFQECRPCPYYIWISPEMSPAVEERYGPGSVLGSGTGTRTFAGSYTTMIETRALTVEEMGDRCVDEWGVLHRRGLVPHVERPPLAGPSLAGYKFPDLTTDEHFAHLDAWIQANAERFRIVQLGSMFFECAWNLRGMEEFLMDLHLAPAFAGELLDGLEAVCTAVIDRLVRDFGDRIDAIGFSEDYGSERSLLVSPEHWRQFVRPRLARMCRRIRDAGKVMYLHSCGHVTPIIPDLVDIGVNMLQPIQPEAMDIFDLKRRFGRDLCLVGGISTQRTLPFGTPADVRAEVRRCLREMAAGGGYIMAPAKPILPGVPVENAFALIDAFTDQS